MAQTYPYGVLKTMDAALIPEKISRTMANLVPEATPLLSTLSPNLRNLDTANGCAMSPIYKFSERAYMPQRTTLNGALTAGSTSVTFTHPIFKQGDNVAIDTEVMTLGVSTSGDNLTFDITSGRSARTGTAAIHVDGSTVLGCGTVYTQGGAALEPGTVVEPNIVTQNTRIIREAVGVSRTMKHVQKHGLSGGNWYEDSKMDKMVECMHQLEHELVFGISTTATATVGGNFDGFFERVGASYYTDMSSTDMTYDAVEDAVLPIADYTEGLGMPGPDYLFIGRHQKAVIDKLGLPYKRDAWTDKVFGPEVDVLRVGGKSIGLVVCSELTSQAILSTSGFVGLGPLTPDDEFSHYYYGNDGDRDKGEIVGEMIAEIKLPIAHHIFYGLLIS